MSAPVISASSSILGFKRNETFAFQPAAAFVLRGELNRFDAEDPTAALGFSAFTGNNGAPVGQVKISCKGIKATISKL